MQSIPLRPTLLVALCALVSLGLIPSASVLSDEPTQVSKEATSASQNDAANENQKDQGSHQEKRRLITVTNNRTTLDVRQWPLIGDPDAKYIFVEMFDYTCPHCRATHNAVRGAMERYGDNLAIITLPTPLDRNCNSAAPQNNSFHTDSCEISRLAVAVWRVQPKQFANFHSWLFQQQRTAAEARQYANQLVGAKELEDELAGVRPRSISRKTSSFISAGAGNVPKLLFPKSTLTGEVSSTDTLCSIIERELGNRSTK